MTIYSTSGLNTYWRIFATGFGFVLFGLVGTLAGSAFVLLLFPLPLPLKHKYRIIRHVLSFAFKIYLLILQGMGLLTHEIHGLDRLQDKGQLLIANHPSLLDIVFLISMVKRANCMVKQETRKNPFTFIPTKIAGFITNTDDSILISSQHSLADGDSLILFPEGTRSTPGKPFNFHRGAANIALSTQHNITPVLIRCNPPTLMKGEKWYKIPATPPHFYLEVFPDIDITPYLEGPQSIQTAHPRS